MRAALISELGATPSVTDVPEPDGQEGALLELRAAALNPVDLTVAAGRFPVGHPELPYVPGVEAVGTVVRSSRLPSGTRVYACGAGLGIRGDGTLSERFVVAEDALYPVPDSVDDVHAVAFGTPGLAAWLPLTWLAPVQQGESMLVLGATGSVGSIAVQAAKLLGAGLVVGVGRDAERLQRAERLGADAVVPIGPDLREELAAAFGDRPPTLILDTLWGEPLVAAMGVAARGARVIHLGQSAGPTAAIPSGLVRGPMTQILGYSNFGVPRAQFEAGYQQLLEAVAAGRISLEVERFRLESIGEAWARQAAGGRKVVVVP